MTGSVLALLLAFAPPGPGEGPNNSPLPSPPGLVGQAVVGEEGFGPQVIQPEPSWLRMLRADLEAVLPGRRWPSSRWGVLAVSLERGDTLFATGSFETLAPASNVKIFTSAAAFHYLGPDFRYPTYLLADGPVEDGVLRGDLILYGTGDPTLSGRLHATPELPFRELARELKAMGIRRVDGNVVGDGSFFTGPARGEGWNPRDLDNWYAAPVSSLSFNENVVQVRIRPAGAAGGRPQVRFLPEGAPVMVENGGRIVAAPPRVPLLMGRSDPDGPLRISGEIRHGGSEAWRTVTVQDPPLYAASVLRRVLQEEGITVVGRSRAIREEHESRVTGPRTFAPAFGRSGPSVLAVHRSPPLQEILEIVNIRSHNLYAEVVSMTLGRILEGEGSFQGGARALERFVEREAGVAGGDVRLVDGSGLSRLNQATAASFVQVLAHMAGSPWWDHFEATLPEAGSNQLRRMYRSAAAGNLRAKTGTIANVSALSGVVRGEGGEPILFSIIANDVPSTGAAKRLEDRIGVRLAALSRPPEGPLVGLAAAAAPGSGRAGGTETLPRGRFPTEMGWGDGSAGAWDPADIALDGGEADHPIPAPGSASHRHTVQPGDTYAGIARRYGVTVQALMGENPTVPARSLRPGQEVVIPPAR